MQDIRLKQDIGAKTLSYNLENETALIGVELYRQLKDALTEQSIVRLCLHTSSDELTQSMIIAIRDDAVIKQHKNIHKDKIYHIIEGSVEFSLHEGGKYTAKQNEIFKLGKNQFASMRALSKTAIYNEIIAGPFQPDDTLYM